MISLRQHVTARLAGMDFVRQGWMPHWRECADYILPRRYQWLAQPNSARRGSPLNGNILDSTGTIAARNLAAGLLAGTASPARPWFKLRIGGQGITSSNPVSLWLAEVEKRMMQVMQESNFYTSLGVMFFDLVVFGTAPMIIDEDPNDIIRCYNPCAGEYFVENSDRGVVDTFARTFVLTVGQVVQWFGLENCSDTIKGLHAGGGANLSQEVLINHLIEPNTERFAGAPLARFPIREIYWESGSSTDSTLSVRGVHENKSPTNRWDLTGNEAYGRSPAMDALPDIKQLQQETRRKAQAIDKMVNPPMMADVQLRNQPTSILPGSITYVSGMANTPGMKPVFQVVPPIRELQEDIAEIQARVRTTFYNDLFLMISQLETVRSASEIDARREEKLILLGPALERMQGEGFNQYIARIYNIMDRAKLFPTKPPALQNLSIQVEYVSMLATAQFAGATAAIERLMMLVGNITAGQIGAGQPPEALDKINTDALIDDYGERLNVSPKLVNDEKRVAQLRDNRNKQLAAAKQQQDTAAMVQGANVLSKTDVGGGINALQAVTGGTMQ